MNALDECSKMQKHYLLLMSRHEKIFFQQRSRKTSDFNKPLS